MESLVNENTSFISHSFDTVDDKTFVYYLHYSKNIDRLSQILANVMPLFPGSIIRRFDKQQIDNSSTNWYQYNPTFNQKVTVELIWILYLNYLISTGDLSNAKNLLKQHMSGSQYTFDPKVVDFFTPKEMSLTNLSLNLKHRDAWIRATSRYDAEYLIVFEDDVLLTDKSKDIIDGLKSVNFLNYDYIDLAGGAGLSAQGIYEETGYGVYNITTYSTRTTCAYFMRTELARKILTLNLPIAFPIDFQLLYIFNILKPRVGWLEPPCFQHGSEKGTYPVSNER